MMLSPYFRSPGLEPERPKGRSGLPEGCLGKQAQWPAHQETAITPAMKEGTVLHSAILEPAVYKTTYAVTGPRNTKAGKEQAAKAEAAGFQVITQTLHDKAAGMPTAVKSHPLAAELL